VAIRPLSRLALHSLGTALRERGRLEDAAATFRRAVQLHPDDARGHIKLGAVLIDMGERDKANDEFRAARRLQPDEGWVRHQIALVFMARGLWDAAIGELNDDLRRKPRNAPAFDALGMALVGAGKLPEAVDAFRTAIHYNPRFGPAYANLSQAFLAQGDFKACLDLLGPGSSGSSGEIDRISPPGRLRDMARHMVALESRLPELVRGTFKPGDAAEYIQLARLCRGKQHFATSCRLWSDVLAAQPALAGNLRAHARYEAACSAALAARGGGEDKSPAEASDRERFLQQALDWLRADLTAYTNVFERGTLRDRAFLPGRLGQWQVDPALACLRDEGALAALPEPQRRACRALFSDAEALRKRILKSGLRERRGPPF
jgi:Flp pilus assembly protein TadD